MRLLLTLVFISTLVASAQTVDRYNFIQKPTETSATIAWRTLSPSIGTIEWSMDAGNLNNVLSDPIATSKHNYEITGLNPNTRYYYRTSTDGGFTSDVDYFFTAKTDSSTKFSFLHYGDCGYNNNVQNEIALLMEGDSTDFGVVAGDVDQGVGDNYDDVFFGVYKDLLKLACHYTAIGNHDTYADNAATYLDAFYLPTNNPQQTERYYSFTWGNAKFVCLDSNSPYTVGTDQYNWMLSEFQCNDRQWLFTFFHHPPWTNAWSADYYLPFSTYFLYQGNEDMRTDLVPLFEQYNVDFVLNGHSHCYQRGELNGVKYIISGGAGSAVIDFNTNSNSPNIDTEIYTNQYVRFDVNADTATYVSINNLGMVIDSVTTIKSNWTSIKPVITLDLDDLVSSPGETYQWFFNGTIMNGETSQSISPVASGMYEVQTTNIYGCTFMSAPFIFNVVSITELVPTGLLVYPNPSNGQIIIQDTFNELNNASFSIYNALGESIYSGVINDNKEPHYTLIDLSNSDKGVYILKITTSEKTYSRLLILK